MISTLLLAAGLAAVPSTSKLGVRVVGDDATWQTLLAASACPRLTVFAISSGSAGLQIAPYRGSCLNGIAIASVGLDSTPAVVAQQSIPTLLSTVPAGAAAVEAPTVTGTDQEILAFWAAFAGAVATQLPGVVPVLAVAPGSPCPTASGTFWWSWRAASPMSEGADDVATTLGYRAVRLACNLSGVQIALTSIAPAAPPWQATDIAWLRWFEARLAEDVEVQGAALTSAGDAAAATSLAPVVDALVLELANPAPSDGGTPDAGVDAGGGSGVVDPHPGTDGPLVPVHTKGCSTGSSGAALAVVPFLFLLRRRLRRRVPQ